MGILKDSFVILATAPVVIAKRMVVFAGGGRKARTEGRRAVTEKAGLAAKSAVSLATGGTWSSIVRSYRKKVQANARRL